MRRLLTASLIAALMVLVLTEFFVPRMVTRGASVALADLLGTGEKMRARIDSEPALNMLFGRFSRITVEGRNIRVGTTVVDRLTTTIHGVALNMNELIKNKRLRFWREGRSIVSTLVIGEKELGRTVWSGTDGLKEPVLEIHDGKVNVQGYLELNHRTFKVAAEGRFLITDPDRISFKVDELWVDEVQLPSAFRDKLMEVIGGPELIFDFGSLPVPVTVSDVDMKEGYLEIRLIRRK